MASFVPEDCHAWSQLLRRRLICRGHVDGAALIVAPSGGLVHAEGRLATGRQRRSLTPELCRLCLNLFRYNCLPAFDAKVLNCRLAIGGRLYRPLEKSPTVVHCTVHAASSCSDCDGCYDDDDEDSFQPPGGLILVRISAGVLLVTYPCHVMRQSAASDVFSFCATLP